MDKEEQLKILQTHSQSISELSETIKNLIEIVKVQNTTIDLLRVMYADLSFRDPNEIRVEAVANWLYLYRDKIRKILRTVRIIFMLGLIILSLITAPIAFEFLYRILN